MTDQDIRTWAKAHGQKIGDRGRIPQQVRDDYDVAHPENFGGFTEVPALEVVPDVAAVNGDQATGETPPKAPPKRSAFQRLREKASPTVTEPRPKKKGEKRVSLEPGGTFVWQLAAMLLGGGRTATSQVMVMEAPVSGAMLDHMVAGTALDRLVQPIARLGEGSLEGGVLLGLPACVYVMDTYPESRPILAPVLHQLLIQYVILAGPLLARAAERERKLLDGMAQFEGMDTVDDLMASIVGMMRQPPPTAEPAGEAVA